MPYLDDAASALRDGLEVKSVVRAVNRAGRTARRIGGGVIIDTRGRRWDPSLHPRDARGRFIETGGIAQVWGGRRGRVVRALGNGRVALRMADNGKVEPHQARRLTMVSRPNGGRPVKDDGTRRSRALVMAEDVNREKNPKRGDGVKGDDDGDGIPNHLDATPEGFKDGDEPDWWDDGKDDDLADGPKYAGKRSNVRPQVLRDEFQSLDDVRSHWVDDLGEHNPAVKDLFDKLESPQLSPEGEHVVGKYDGKWRVFRTDDAKMVAGHNGSRTLTSKPAALERASQLDDVYDPDAPKRAPARKTATGRSIPRGHDDAGDGYTTKKVVGTGGGLDQVEVFGPDGGSLGQTTSSLDSRKGQSPGWKGDVNGVDVSAHSRDEYLTKVKKADALMRLERDPEAIGRLADRAWRMHVDGNGGDVAKAARAVRQDVNRRRARGKGAATTPKGRVAEKINAALLERANRGEAPAAGRGTGRDRQDAPVRQESAAAAAPAAKVDPEPAAAVEGTGGRPGPEASKHGVDDVWKSAVDTMTVDELEDARSKNLTAMAASARAGDADLHRRRIAHLDEMLADRGVTRDPVDAPGQMETPPAARKPLREVERSMSQSPEDRAQAEWDAISDRNKGDVAAAGKEARQRVDELNDQKRYGDAAQLAALADKHNPKGARRQDRVIGELRDGDGNDRGSDKQPSTQPDAPSSGKQSAPAGKRPKLADDDPDRISERNTHRDLANGVVTRNTADGRRERVGQILRDPDRKGQYRAVHADGTVLAGGRTKEHAAENLRDHHNGDATREWKPKQQRAARPDDPKRGEAAQAGEDSAKGGKTTPNAGDPTARRGGNDDDEGRGARAAGGSDDDEARDSRTIEFRKENEASAQRGEQSARDELDRSNQAVDGHRQDPRPEVQDAIRRYDEADGGNRLGKRKAARDVEAAAKEKETDRTIRPGNDDREGASGKDNGQQKTPQERLDALEKYADPDSPDYDEQTAVGVNNARKALADGDERMAGVHLNVAEAFARMADRNKGRRQDNDRNPTDGGPRDDDSRADQAGREGSLDEASPEGVGDDDGDRADAVPGSAGGRGGDGNRGSGRGIPSDDDEQGPAEGGAEGAEPVGEGAGGRAAGAGVPAVGGGRGSRPSRGGRGGSARGRGDVPDASADSSGSRKRVARPSRFRPKGQEDLAPTGKGAAAQRAKLAANMEALRTLRKIQSEDRNATPDEQAVLARWAGWGSLPQVFARPEYAKERAELTDLLSPAEYEAAMDNALNAHYTDARLIDPMWEALRGLGFDGGEVLEAGSGSGNFIGLAPDGVHVTGVEKEPITAAISKLNYPDATIKNESFGDTKITPGSFDAAIGNVPFGNFPVYDPTYNPGNKLNIHDHFIAKEVAALKPGGVMAVITSAGTLDKNNGDARRAIGKDADLLGAVRLPSSAHEEAAGTQVVTDVLVLRKRMPGEEPGEQTWLTSSPALHPNGSPVMGTNRSGGAEHYAINDYFRDNPDMVLGELADGGFNGMAVTGDPAQAPAQLREALTKIVRQAREQGRVANPQRVTKKQAAPQRTATSKRKDGLSERTAKRQPLVGQISHVKGVDDAGKAVDKFIIRDDEGNDVEHEVPSTQVAELKALINLRNTMLDLEDAEKESTVDTDEIRALRKDLERQYDAYTGNKKWGPLARVTKTVTATTEPSDLDNIPDSVSYNEELERWEKTTRRKPDMGGFRKDPTWWSLLSLESDYDEDTGQAKKSPIFKGRMTDNTRAIPKQAEDANDALAISMEKHRRVDLDDIASMLDVTPEQARAMLGGLIIEDHETGDLVPVRRYIGNVNVRKKLREVKVLAEQDPKWNDNVKLLEAAVPPDKDPTQISAKLGASWIQKDDFQQFVRDLTGNRGAEVELGKDKNGNDYWTVRIGSGGSRNPSVEGGRSMRPPSGHTPGTPILARWGTRRRNTYDLVQAALNQGRASVEDEIEGGKKVLNVKETDAANEQLEKIQSEFSKWLWRDDARAKRLHEAFNDKYRGYTDMNYVDSPERAYVGMTKELDLDPHQNDAVTMAVENPTVMLDHEVGTGKTFTQVATAAELRRLGAVNKPVWTVPNHLLEQAVREARFLYPNHKILGVERASISKDDDLARFAAQAKGNDWDLVVMTHAAFKHIPLSEGRLNEIDDEKISKLRAKRTEAANRGDTAAVKKIGAEIAALEAKIRERRRRMEAGKGADFETIGFDYLIVDEAHLFKNDEVQTSITGLEKLKPNLGAVDLREKLDWLREDAAKKGRSNVAMFATGTPVSNSTREFYVMARFLRPDLLNESGLMDFDKFAASFLEMAETVEPTVSGKLQVKVRPGDQLINTGELKRLWSQFVDTVTADDAGIERPTLRGGKAEVFPVDASPNLLKFMRYLKVRRASLKPSWKPQKGDDTPVAIGQDGLTAAVDLRLIPERKLEAAGIDPQSLTLADSKVPHVGDKLLDEWRRTKDMTFKVRKGSDEDHPVPGALQVVFADKGIPKKDRHSFYKSLKDYLVENGMGRDEVAFIHDAEGNPAKLGRLMEDARTGKLKVLIGSTPKMGTGLNAQNRMSYLWHVDGAYRPDMIEQRNGRVVRRGNQNDEVGIGYLPVVQSNEGFQWSHVARKDNFLRQFAMADLDATIVGSPESDTASEADYLSAVTADNPLMLDDIQVDQAFKRLANSVDSHVAAVEYHEGVVRNGKTQVANIEQDIALVDQAAALARDMSGDNFRFVTANGVAITSRKDAAEWLSEWVRDTIGGYAPQGVGYPRKVGTLGGLEVWARTRREFGDPKVEFVLSTPTSGPYDSPKVLSTGFDEVQSSLSKDITDGVVQRILNRHGGLTGRGEQLRRQLAARQAEIGVSEVERTRTFDRMPEFEALRNRRDKLKALMRMIAQADNEDGQGNKRTWTDQQRADIEAAQREYEAASEVYDRLHKEFLARADSWKPVEMGAVRNSRRKIKAEQAARVREATGQKKVTRRRRKSDATVDEAGAPKDLTSDKPAATRGSRTQGARPGRSGTRTPRSGDGDRQSSAGDEEGERVELDPAQVRETLDSTGADSSVLPDGEATQEPVTLDPADVRETLDGVGADSSVLPDTSAVDSTPDVTPAGEADTPDVTPESNGDGPELVDAGTTFGGQNAGQTMLGGEGFEMGGEQFMLTDTAPAPKPAPAPAAPSREADDLFDAGDAPIVDKTPAVQRPALSVRAGDRIRTPDGKVHDVVTTEHRRDGVLLTTRDEDGAESSDLYDIGESFTVLTPESSSPQTPDAPETPAAADTPTPDAPNIPNAESDAVAAVGSFNDLHDTISAGLRSDRLRDMLDSDIMGARLTPGEYRDELDRVIPAAESRLANARRALEDPRNRDGGAGAQAWRDEVDGYLHDLPVLHAARDKAAALADGWEDPTPAETARLREARRAVAEDRVAADAVEWSTNDAGRLVGTFDGHRAEVAKGTIGVNKKVHIRSFDRDGNDTTNDYWFRTGMIPNGAKTKAEAEEMVKDSIARDLNSMAQRDRARELRAAEEAYEAARSGRQEGDTPTAAPAQVDGPPREPSLPDVPRPAADREVDFDDTPSDMPSLPEGAVDGPPREANTPAVPAAQDTPPTPDVPVAGGRMKKNTVYFHEQYGNVSGGQLQAYRKHNVSPSDHQDLVDRYGEDAHEQIRQAVIDPANHTSPDSGVFAEYRWRQNLADTPGRPDPTPDGDGPGGGGGGRPPAAPTGGHVPDPDDPYHPDNRPDDMESVPTPVRQIVPGQIIPGRGQVVSVGDTENGRVAVTVRDKNGRESTARFNPRSRIPVWTPATTPDTPQPPPSRAARIIGKKRVPGEDGRTDRFVFVRDDGTEVDVPELIWNNSPAPEQGRRDSDTPIPGVDEPAPTADDLPDPAEESIPDPDPVEAPTPDVDPAPAPAAPMSEKETYVRGRIDGEKYDPNPQQGDIYTAAAVGTKSVVVEAKAGAGKTSTLEGLARRIQQLYPDARILYAAFNKAVQIEAEGRMPSNVETRTGHSLGWTYVGPQISSKFGKPGMFSNDKDIARHLGITSNLGGLTPREQANAIKKAVKDYVLSAEDQIEAEHFPASVLGQLDEKETAALVKAARRAWDDIKSPTGRLRVTRDDFRKMWALSRPDFTKTGSGAKRRATILFVDEAQDTPPVLAKVFADQNMQTVIVGDPDQAIYGFAGATDYLSKAEGDVRLPLDKSYRYGPQIADWGNRFLQLLGSRSRAIGGGPESRIVDGMDNADAVLVRSNSGLIAEAVEELGRDRVVGVPKDTKSDLLSLIDSAAYLRGEGGFPKGGMHEDLEPFHTWAEVKKEANAGDKKLAMMDRLITQYDGTGGLRGIVDQLVEAGDDPLGNVEFDRDDRSITVSGDTYNLNLAVKEALGNPKDGPGMGRNGLGWSFGKDESGKGTWTVRGDRDAQERALVRLRELLGADDRPEPDVTISTAHKAKGLEWDRVRIGDDFPAPKVDESTGELVFPADEELRLNYVAATRAARELDPGSLAWVLEYTDEDGGKPGDPLPKKLDADAVRDVMEATGADASVLPERAPDTTPAPDVTPDAPSAASAPDPVGTSRPDPVVPSTADGRPLTSLSEDELFGELDRIGQVSTPEQERQYLAVMDELEQRERQAEEFGQAAPKRVTEADLRADVHADNLSIIDRGWDGDTMGGYPPSYLLGSLPGEYLDRLLDGKQIPGEVIAKYVAEEAILHVWKMTPDEMRGQGKMQHWSIPGAVRIRDVVARRNRDAGFDRTDDPRGVLDRDVVDLHDDELDEAARITPDEEHLAWLSLEQSRRARMSDEERDAEVRARRARRGELDDRGDVDDQSAEERTVEDQQAPGSDAGRQAGGRLNRRGDDDDDSTPVPLDGRGRGLPGDVNRRGSDDDDDAGRDADRDSGRAEDRDRDNDVDPDGGGGRGRRYLDGRERDRDDDDKDKDEDEERRRKRKRGRDKNRRKRDRGRGGGGGPDLPDLDGPNNDDDDSGVDGASGGGASGGGGEDVGADSGQGQPGSGAGTPNPQPRGARGARGARTGRDGDSSDVDETGDRDRSGDTRTGTVNDRPDTAPTGQTGGDGSTRSSDGTRDAGRSAPSGSRPQADAGARAGALPSIRPDHVRQDVWDRARGFADVADQAGVPYEATVRPDGRIRLAVTNPSTGERVQVRLAPGRSGRRGDVVLGGGRVTGPDGTSRTLPGPEVGQAWRAAVAAHNAARPADSPSRVPAAPRARDGVNGPQAGAQDVTPPVPTGGVSPDGGSSDAAASADVPDDATWRPGVAGDLEPGSVIRHPRTGKPVRVASVEQPATDGQPVRVRLEPATAGDDVSVSVDPDEVLTIHDVTASIPSSGQARPGRASGQPTPNVPASAESAPSTPGTPASDDALVGVDLNQDGGGNALGRGLSGAIRDNYYEGYLESLRNGSGPFEVEPSWAAAKRNYDQGRIPDRAALERFLDAFEEARRQWQEQQATGGTPTGTPAAAEAVPDLDDATPTVPDAPRPNVPDAELDLADRPLPDGLDAPREPLPDAFDTSGDVDEPTPAPDRPWLPNGPAETDPAGQGRPSDRGDDAAVPDGPGDGQGELELDLPAGDGTAPAVSAPRRRRPGWAARAREAMRRSRDRRGRGQSTPGGDATPAQATDGGARPAAPEEATEPVDVNAAVAAYVTPDVLQIGDYARVEGYDVSGKVTAQAGFLVNDPQPVVVDVGNGEVDMLAITMSDDYDGLGISTTVYVPLDTIASLAPRPRMDEVPDDGWMLDENRLKVRDGRMPDRVPTDRNGLGMFPGSVISDGRRRGRVVQTRARDVAVLWDDEDEVQDRSGTGLSVIDSGAARPDGWTTDGRRVTRIGKGGQQRRRRGQSDGSRVAQTEWDNEHGKLTEDLFRRIDELTRQIQARNLTARQQEAAIRKLARDAVRESQQRRAEAARRIAAAYPHRPGLIAQIAAWLQRMAVAVAEAFVSFLFMFRAGWRDGSTGIASRERMREFAEESRNNPRFTAARRGLERTLEPRSEESADAA